MSQLPNIIAYQGVEGAYSHLSCRHVYPNMTAKACGSLSMQCLWSSAAKQNWR